MLYELTQGFCLVSEHMVLFLIIKHRFALGKLTEGLCMVTYPGFVLGKLTQGSHLVSYHRVCVW